MVRSVGRAFIKEMFQDRETMVVKDVGVPGSDVYGHHDGIGRERGEGRDCMILRK